MGVFSRSFNGPCVCDFQSEFSFEGASSRERGKIWPMFFVDEGAFACDENNIKVDEK